MSSTTAPDLPYVPLFEALRGYTRAMQAAYGAIAAYQHVGHRPTVAQIAAAASIADRRHCERAIAELIRVQLMRRVNVGAPKSRARYVLLGPTLRVASVASAVYVEPVEQPRESAA